MSEFARRTGAKFKRGPVAESLSASIPTLNVNLLLPLSYMNLSGRPVAAALRWQKLEFASLIVVCDDVNLPFGKLRIRGTGGAGGQKGLKSILETLGTEEIPRMRLGVGGGEPGADVGFHVLRKLRGSELDQYHELASRAADALEVWLESGMETAMNRFNSVDNP